jgi:hypothetical protein
VTDEVERLIAMAARNNADWCDGFCRLHGIQGEFRRDAWTSSARTPRFYPDAVTLVRAADPAAILSRIDASSGCSIKDSYAELDFARRGFEVLFDATWLRRSGASRLGAAGSLDWQPVRDDPGLVAWETAWGADPAGPRAFPPGLLARDDVVILAGRRSGAVVAGAILNAAAGVVGVSNIFATDIDPAEAFASAAEMAGRLWPGLTLVGYEAAASSTRRSDPASSPSARSLSGSGPDRSRGDTSARITLPFGRAETRLHEPWRHNRPACMPATCQSN